MIRKSCALGGLMLLLSISSGCCLRDRPLFQRWRARGAAPDNQRSQVPYVATPYFGAECPCATPGVPGGVIPGTIVPGMEFMPPGGGMPPIMQPPANPPGMAPTAPADPSKDGNAGIKKATGAVPTSKTGQ